MQLRRRSSIALLAGALLILPGRSSGLAAQQTGTIRGTVTASDGATLVGATVLVQGTGLGTLTGDGGAFVIPDVPAGSRTVQAQFLGFRTAVRTVEVPPGGEVTVTFALERDPLSLEEIVVTGTATGGRKLEATYSITTLNAEQVQERGSKSTAELLNAVPGFYVESSGGVGGNNVWARGLPQDGSFRFISLQTDGLPVFDSPELAFTNIDQLHRADLTVERMEAVRGGSATIFASNAPGGLINFVSKTGGEELAGEARLTVGDYNLFRVDFNYGGPLADSDDWRFNLGGFYRQDTGIRDPGFTANEGGQVKANVTRYFEDGFVRVYGTFLNDENIFYLPVPLQNPDDPTDIPGFDANFGTLTSLDAARVEILNPEQDPLERNLKDGVEVEYRSGTAEFNFDLGDGWSLVDRARLMAADVQFNAVFSLFNPITAEAFAEQKTEELGGSGAVYTFSTSGQPVTDPASLNGNGLVVESGWWGVTKDLENFVNDLRLTRTFEEIGNTLTFGFYSSWYGADEFWNFNNILQEVRDKPRLLDLTVTGTPEGSIDVTKNGFTRFGSFYRNATSDARVFAGYIENSFQATDRLTIDVGFRYESGTYTGNVEVLDDFDLGDPTTTADDQVTWGTGQFLPYDFEFDDVAGSIGVNFSLNEQLAFFARGTNGFRQPDFEQWTDGSVDAAGASQDVWQYEGGVKFGSPRLGIFATGFFSTLDEIPFVDEVVDETTGELVTLRRFGETETLGVETEVVFRPVDMFELDITATAQDPELTSLRFETEPPPGVDPENLTQFDGNQIRRVPEWILQIRPKYIVPHEIPYLGGTELFGSFHYIGERFTDDANEAALPDYAYADMGIRIPFTERVLVQANVGNVFNTVGLTEGNPRVGQVIGTQQDIFMARPILGRSGSVSLGYRF